MKLDIFGEVVVTLGTVPQGQGHETTASQVVADILGCSPDQVHVRPGHDTFFNSHAGFSGTYASQFAVTGLGAVKGAAELLRAEMIQLAAAVLQCEAEQIELADGFARIKDGPPEAALPFMALGAIVNANNAFLPPDFNPTLNHRFVYRPYFGMVDTEKKTGQADADLRDADPRVRGRGRPGDRRRRDRRLRRRGRLRHRGSTRRSSRARCTARPRTRSAPRSSRTSSTTRTGSS